METNTDEIDTEVSKDIKEVKTYIVLENKVVVARYNSDINSEIPLEAIKVDNGLWEDLQEYSQPRLKNNKTQNFTIDDFEENIHEPTKQEKAQMEIVELEIWFKWYDEQIAQYNRSIRLGTEFEENIEELDVQAVQNSERIKELRKLLQEEA